MRTPDGKECPHYHEDFHRGRDVQECRLVKTNPDSLRWHPHDCVHCPIPAILNANSSRDMELKLSIQSKLLGIRREMRVAATCLRHQVMIEDPFLGCEQCRAERPGLDIFIEALGQDDD